MLKIFFSEFVDLTTSYNLNSVEIENLKQKIKVEGICAVCPDIDIEKKCFCFTGVSSWTTRVEIEKLILNLGGKYRNSVSRDTDYLIIGNNGNPCWAFSCYGRKVEKAVEMRKAGHRILIVHGNDFWDAVEDMGA